MFSFHLTSPTLYLTEIPLKHGVGNWKTILQDPDLKFHDRSAVDLKDRHVFIFRMTVHNLTEYSLAGSAPTSPTHTNATIQTPAPISPAKSVPPSPTAPRSLRKRGANVGVLSPTQKTALSKPDTRNTERRGLLSSKTRFSLSRTDALRICAIGLGMRFLIYIRLRGINPVRRPRKSCCWMGWVWVGQRMIISFRRRLGLLGVVGGPRPVRGC